MYSEAFQEHAELDLAAKALAAFKRCTQPGEELLALDWNHQCFYFDPRRAARVDHLSEWALPVLPQGDMHFFVAQDCRFGTIANCLHNTVCVFGRELLEALEAAPPLIFRRPTWTAEARWEMEERWAERGWVHLEDDDSYEIRDEFDSGFCLPERQKLGQCPIISEPSPSLTWQVTADFEDQFSADHATGSAELTLKILAALKQATQPDEQLYALDFHRRWANRAFFPHRLNSASRDSWALPVWSDEIFCIILSQDFRLGIFGNPLEKSLCIFGEELLDAIKRDPPLSFDRVLRRNGVPEPVSEL